MTLKSWLAHRWNYLVPRWVLDCRLWEKSRVQERPSRLLKNLSLALSNSRELGRRLARQ